MERPNVHTFPENGTLSMLINDLSRLFDNRMRRETERIGMASSYRRLLFHLVRSSELTQLDLVHLTHLSPPSVSVTLQKMEADGLVNRRVNEADLRETLVSLTDKGIKLDAEVRKKLEESEQVMERGLLPEQKQQLKELMLMMRNNMIEDGAVPERGDRI